MCLKKRRGKELEGIDTVGSIVDVLHRFDGTVAKTGYGVIALMEILLEKMVAIGQ